MKKIPEGVWTTVGTEVYEGVSGTVYVLTKLKRAPLVLEPRVIKKRRQRART